MTDLRSTRLLPSRVALLLSVCATVGIPVSARAQQDCEFAEGTRSVQVTTLPGGGQITYFSQPHFSCSDDVKISADSAVSYSQLGYSDLIGNVRYTDLQRTLRADNARYFGRQGRLQAHGSVFLEDSAQGSTIRNGDLIYLRQSDTRKREQITVTTAADGVRPHATLYMRPAEDTTTVASQEDTARTAPVARATPPDTARRPYDVVADRILLEGDQYFRATGNVVIERDSLHARSQTAEYDQAAGRLMLQGEAKVESSDYDLRADSIDIGVPSGAIRDVRAVRHAVLVGQDLRLTSPLIRMFLEDGLLNRLVAIPLWKDSAEAARAGNPKGSAAGGALAARPGVPLARDSAQPAAQDTSNFDRPVAVAEKFHLTADSLEVNAPDQELKRIFAAGDARGSSDARDSLNVDSLPEVARKDWVEGDTVIVTFVPVPPDSARADSVAPPPPGQDTARARYRVDRLIAEGNARSLYRMLPSDSTARPGIDPPAVHYATGSRITIVMKEGEVDRMEVEGPTKGWHLEPIERHAADTLAPRADSLGHRSDTAAVRVDTSGVAPPDTAAVGADTSRAGSPGSATRRSRGLPPGSSDPWHDSGRGVACRSEPAEPFSGGWGGR